jgi:PAS domain S-box-containing protein
MRTARDDWSGLFATAFEQSRNAMILTDAQRVMVDVNPALLALLGRKKSALTGRPTYSIVADGPLASEEEWAAAMAEGRFSGVADFLHAEGGTVGVQWAASTETVTGRRLVLVVVVERLALGSALPAPLVSRRARSRADPAPTGDRAPRGARRVRSRDWRRAAPFP